MKAPSASEAAIGARLRQLSARIDREASAIYRLRGIDFEQRWYGVVDALARSDRLGVQELAARLGTTHVSISQIRKALEAKGLVSGVADPDDARRTVLSLTPAGRDLARQLAEIWAALNQAGAELNAEAGNVMAGLRRLEQALDARSLSERVAAYVPVRTRARGAPRGRPAARG